MPADWRNLTLDVLKQIYSLCEDRDLPKCARTCKNWTGLALDRVWSELRPKDFIHLFAILAPLRPSQDQTDDALVRMEFTRRISQGDWERFLQHSSRVRSITESASNADFTMISEKALAEFLMTKPPTSPILPRCQSIVFGRNLNGDYPWCHFYTGLLHEGLREIIIFVPNISPQEIVPLLEEATWRSPNIASLTVDSGSTSFDADVNASLLSSTSKMLKLTRTTWPSCFLSAQLLSVLEALPDLQTVSILDDTYLEGSESDGTLPRTVEPGRFPQLTSLMLQCSLDELCRYLSHANGIAPGLLHLSIDIILKTRPVALQNTLVKIAAAFPTLTSLAITRREDLSIFDDDDESTRSPLHYQNLRPVTTMPHLQSFQLNFEGVVSLTNAELCSLLARCPSMKILKLNHEPMDLKQTMLTINVLPMIAKLCPQLEDLALYVNTDVDPLEPSSLFTFKNLKTIDLGLSILESKGVVARLLAQVLPRGCKLVSNPAFHLDAEDHFAYGDEDSDVRDERRNEWVQLSEWISIMLEVRQESCERALMKPEE
ncbi:hypothetical protein SCHPADRAFT_1003054 [Schizopora paradoxa]|uniref:F-box domain-containing protein n=1 Tax=Schizopora paradoxa TaxID=27342 RepID=A0A0H2R008_9AGAM|nr:hypothetical protein SCHPADRAFT_1003054 [Schizopora paradoxa]